LRRRVTWSLRSLFCADPWFQKVSYNPSCTPIARNYVPRPRSNTVDSATLCEMAGRLFGRDLHYSHFALQNYRFHSQSKRFRSLPPRRVVSVTPPWRHNHTSKRVNMYPNALRLAISDEIHERSGRALRRGRVHLFSALPMQTPSDDATQWSRGCHDAGG
jgi:hypothetical protein